MGGWGTGTRGDAPPPAAQRSSIGAQDGAESFWSKAPAAGCLLAQRWLQRACKGLGFTGIKGSAHPHGHQAWTESERLGLPHSAHPSKASRAERRAAASAASCSGSSLSAAPSSLPVSLPASAAASHSACNCSTQASSGASGGGAATLTSAMYTAADRGPPHDAHLHVKHAANLNDCPPGPTKSRPVRNIQNF